MTIDPTVHPHRCPRCELLFATSSELGDHMAVDHGVITGVRSARIEAIANRWATRRPRRRRSRTTTDTEVPLDQPPQQTRRGAPPERY